jgi:hypothetical protein
MTPLSGMRRRMRRLASAHLGIAIGVLVLTAALSIAAESPVRSILPYGVAVALVAWRHGMSAGFVFAALATFAALAAGAFPTRAELSGEEAGEGLFTYFKLSAIAVGVAIGKRTRRNNQKP